MGPKVFEILEPGLGAALQDRGRPGWRRFGVPPGGAMDDHAAHWANRLLDNPPDAPVVEFLLRGPTLRVWRAPQWDLFSETDRELFFAQEWAVSSRSDRVGYRLAGRPLKPSAAQILSEPVLVGSIQIPPDGQPIVTMRDGPTVGGYPKLGLVEAADVSWLAQCRPGVRVRFQLLS